MIIKTERLFLRELTKEDFSALYAVPADSDIMQHYPYTFDDAKVKIGLSATLLSTPFIPI